MRIVGTELVNGQYVGAAYEPQPLSIDTFPPPELQQYTAEAAEETFEASGGKPFDGYSVIRAIADSHALAARRARCPDAVQPERWQRVSTSAEAARAQLADYSACWASLR